MLRAPALRAATPSDAELAQGCIRGDKPAWDALVSRYSSLLYSVPLRYGLSGPGAAAVFEQTCKAILRELPAAARGEDLGHWMAAVASRECWEFIRQQLLTAPSPNGSAALEPLRDEVVEELEEQYHLRQGLQTLGKQCQALLLGLYYHHPPKSYSEVAREAGIKEQEVGPHRASCLWHLKQALEQTGHK